MKYSKTLHDILCIKTLYKRSVVLEKLIYQCDLLGEFN